MRRRPVGGLWSGLWEFPNREVNGRSQAWRSVGLIAREYGIQLQGSPQHVGTVRHQLTHRSLTFHVCIADAPPHEDASDRPASLRWVTTKGFARLCVSTAHRRIFQAVQEAVVPGTP